ncbi:MAG: carbohydrate kinase, YjeF related protein [Moraxellaceae bacterium]|nr:carbohydrate kinase, YjeF related protein [Moraxellaceae bacterium]
MPQLPRSLYTAAQVRELDRRAIAAGVAGYALMTRAGQAAFQRLRERWPQASRIVVLAGPGNNGGDGYVLARLAWNQHLDVKIVTVGDHDHLAGEAAEAASDATRARVPEVSWQGRLPEADVYVDALFGTGLNKPVAGDFAAAIAALNASGRPVLALDIPSGVQADTGAELGEAVRADATISFIGLKAGLFTGRGPALTGEVFFHALSVAAAVYEGIAPVAQRLTATDLAVLGCRPRDAHKGMHGHVLVVGGNQGMAGAVALAGEAALRSGAGLVSVATRPAHTGVLTARRPEIMCHGVERAGDLAPLLAKADVVVLGPGLGRDDWGRALFGAVLDSRLPLVLDADALNLLAEMPEQRADWILTPHPGEAGRLLGLTTAQVQADRFAAVRALRERYGGSIVLKGAGTLVQDDAGLSLCPYGNPGMATAGMGDVLSGVAGALRAQQVPQAAAMAVLVHALAGDRAAHDGGERGLMASDLFPFLRLQVNP